MGKRRRVSSSTKLNPITKENLVRTGFRTRFFAYESVVLVYCGVSGIGRNGGL